MSAADHNHDLIHKYFEARLTEAEQAELEALLASDPEVAGAFANAARLEAGLQAFFRTQYKTDQVAALLARSEAETDRAPAEAPAAAPPAARVEPAAMVRSPLPPGSTFIPRFSRDTASRRAGIARHFERAAGRWKPIAAALLVLAVAAVWLSRPPDSRFPIAAGRVVIAGREVSAIPAGTIFEVAGPAAAAIQLPDGARLELAPQTRAALRRDANRLVMRLATGGGDFRITAEHPLAVETALGTVTCTQGRFSLEFLAAFPPGISPAGAVQVPRLAIVVAEGSVSVERAGTATTISAGQQQVFL